MALATVIEQQYALALQQAQAEEAAPGQGAFPTEETDDIEAVDRGTYREMVRVLRGMHKEILRRGTVLEQDLNAELASKGRPGLWMMASAGADGVNVVDLGTFSTLLNYIIVIARSVTAVYLMYQYATIRYSPERAVRRQMRLAQKAMMRELRSLLLAAPKLVPFLSVLPMWSVAQGWKWLDAARNTESLQSMKKQCMNAKKELERYQPMRFPTYTQFDVDRGYLSRMLTFIKKLETDFDTL